MLNTELLTDLENSLGTVFVEEYLVALTDAVLSLSTNLRNTDIVQFRESISDTELEVLQSQMEEALNIALDLDVWDLIEELNFILETLRSI